MSSMRTIPCYVALLPWNLVILILFSISVIVLLNLALEPQSQIDIEHKMKFCEVQYLFSIYT